MQQQNNWKQVMVWGFISAIIHISLLTPLLIVTIWFAIVPAVMLYVNTKLQTFLLTMILVTIIVLLIFSNLGFQWLWLIVGLTAPAVAIGESYRRNQSAILSIRNGAMTLLGYSLLTLMILALAGYDMNQELNDMIRSEIQTLAIAFQGVITEQQILNMIQLITITIPFYLIIVSVLISAITHGISRKICNYAGINLAGMLPLRDWKLNRSLVWFYLLIIVLELFIDIEQANYFTTAIVNLYLILSLTFALLGFGFLLFIARVKNQRWIPWVAILAFFIISPLMFTALSLLGVFDTAFRIRERVQNSYER